jgi:hypothetical protein
VSSKLALPVLKQRVNSASQRRSQLKIDYLLVQTHQQLACKVASYLSSPGGIQDDSVDFHVQLQHVCSLWNEGDPFCHPFKAGPLGAAPSARPTQMVTREKLFKLGLPIRLSYTSLIGRGHVLSVPQLLFLFPCLATVSVPHPKPRACRQAPACRR